MKLFQTGLILLVAFSLSAQTITGEKGDYRAAITKKFDIEAGGILIIRIASGDVKIQSWNNNSVEIKEKFRLEVNSKEKAAEMVQEYGAEYSKTGNTLEIRAEQTNEDVQRDFEILTPEKLNLDVKTAGGDLDVDGLDGSILLYTRGGDLDLVRLSGDIKADTKGGDIDLDTISGRAAVATAGGDINVENLYAEATLSSSGGDIDVINAKNRISLNTAGGDIDLEKIEGELDAYTSGGDVSLKGCTGRRINLQTMGGDIEFEDIEGEISASTRGGDLQGNELDGAVNVRTMGGDIDLANLRAAVDAQSMGGDIDVEMTLQDFSRPHGINAETAGGDITVVLPEKLPATIEAEIRLDRKAELYKRYDIYSDFPLTKYGPDETGGRILRSTGEINGGGDLIKLKSNGGNIYIKKQN